MDFPKHVLRQIEFWPPWSPPRRGQLHTFCPPPYTLYPQTGVFLKVWCPPSPSKKTAPGNSRFKPRNSILQGNVCKILLVWEKWLVFASKLEINVNSQNIENLSDSQRIWTAHHEQNALCRSILFQKCDFRKNTKCPELSGQTRACISSLGPAAMARGESVQINKAGLPKPAPQCGHFILHALIWTVTLPKGRFQSTSRVKSFPRSHPRFAKQRRFWQDRVPNDFWRKKNHCLIRSLSI